MKVIATRTGYYQHKRVYKGETLVLADEKHFSKAWMKQADSSAQVAQPAPSPQVQPLVEPESDEVI